MVPEAFAALEDLWRRAGGAARRAAARDAHRRRPDPAHRLQDRDRGLRHHRGGSARGQRDLAAANRPGPDGRGGPAGGGRRVPERAVPAAGDRPVARSSRPGLRVLPGRRRALDPDPLEPAAPPRGGPQGPRVRRDARGGRGRGGRVDGRRPRERVRGRGAAHRHGALAGGMARPPAGRRGRHAPAARDRADRRGAARAAGRRSPCALGRPGARPHAGHRGTGLRAHAGRVRGRRAAGHRAAPSESPRPRGRHRPRQALGVARSPAGGKPRTRCTG